MSNKFLDYQGLETLVTNIKDKINMLISVQPPIYSISSIDYQNNITIPNDGEIIVIYDYKQTIDGKNIPGFIIGDGRTELRNLFVDIDYVDDKINNIQTDIEATVNRLMTDTELKFFCIEPVTVNVTRESGDKYSRTFQSNTLCDMFLTSTDTFDVIPTSDNSILSLSAWPGALNTYYSWLEGVQSFNGILFDMNTEEMYTKWSQGNQLKYHVQKAQYKDCVFWSDLPYISDVTKRTNYTLLNSAEAPLCYSTIPDNTFKAFYLARGIKNDSNWCNPAYLESFSKATWSTQVWSYYGACSIGLAMEDTSMAIKLPKDCRGLCFASNTIQNIGTLDAINVTNFGYRTNSWACAFSGCYSLEQIYIINLKTHINFAWSPVIPSCIQSIIDNAINTSNLNIHVSSWTYYRLPQSTFDAAKNKNITIIEGSPVEAYFPLYSNDKRLQLLQLNGDGNSYLANDGTYKTITIPEVPSLDGYAKLEDIPTKLSSFENDNNYVSLNVVQQMIDDAIANLNNPVEPEEPEEPTEPEVPTGSIGIITSDNSIVVDETQLENGTYTLKYIDENENIIDNFNEITSFEINK